MKFAKVPVCQFLPPLNFSPVETEIIHAEISKRLSKGLIVNTTYLIIMFPGFFQGPKKIVVIEWYTPWKHSINFWKLNTAN